MFKNIFFILFLLISSFIEAEAVKYKDIQLLDYYNPGTSGKNVCNGMWGYTNNDSDYVIIGR